MAKSKLSPVDRLAQVLANITYEEMMEIGVALEEKLSKPKVRNAADFAAALHEIITSR